MNSFDEKAEKFVKALLTEGTSAACDDSADSFNRKTEELPLFYNEELFKRGQRLFHENIYSFFGATFFGLVSVVSVPSIRKVLIHTKQSSSDLTAYRRYRATTIYYRMWHDYQFGPNSDLWKALTAVRKLHNAASKAHHKNGEPRISQSDMALTQFGFMGFHLVRSRFFALDHLNEDEWTAYIHYWRVLGWILGIDDRFNICRESVEETKKICEIIIEELLLYYQRDDNDFKNMVRYICNGLWHVDITLNYNVVMAIFPMILENDFDDEKKRVANLSLYEKLIALQNKLSIDSMKLPFMRNFWNLKQNLQLWMADHIPWLAIWDYGYRNSFVYVLGKDR